MKEISTFTYPVEDKITVKYAKGSMDLKFSDDTVVWTSRGTEQAIAPTTDCVLCGFGINTPGYGRNDYANVDVKRKIVVATVSDPGFYDTSLFRGRNMAYYGRWTYKFEEAQRQGAVGLLVLHNETAASYGWKVCQASHMQTNIALRSKTMNAEALGMKGWLSEEACKKMFTLSGLSFDETIAAAKKLGFKSFTVKARSKVILNVKMTVDESHNVAAVLPGMDLGDGHLVFTIHWDHFGVGAPIDRDNIYNGASDSAPGVAILVLLAKKYQSLPVHSRRSTVFVAVTSEGCGLLDSQYYCEHPLLPLFKTAINLSFDGTAPRERTHDISLRAAGKTGTDVLVITMASAQGRIVKVITKDPTDGYFRSDHFNFVRKGVPTILVGGDKDYVDKTRREVRPKVYQYHQPNDEYDGSWWNLDGTMEDMNLTFSIGLVIASNDEMSKRIKRAGFQRQ